MVRIMLPKVLHSRLSGCKRHAVCDTIFVAAIGCNNYQRSFPKAPLALLNQTALGPVASPPWTSPSSSFSSSSAPPEQQEPGVSRQDFKKILRAKFRALAEKKEPKSEEEPKHTDFRAHFNSGQIESVAGGIVEVSGVPDAHLGSILSFLTKKGEVFRGLVMQMRPDRVCAAVLGDVGRNIAKGNPVLDDGSVASFPVGYGCVGRVIDALGVPLDDKGPLKHTHAARTLTLKTPSVVSRAPLTKRIHTGIKQIDFFHPMAHGVRLAVVAPANCGKTDIALEVVCNQVERNRQATTLEQKLFCVYVCVGKTPRQISKIVHVLESRGAMEFTTVISAPQRSAVPFQYLAPFAGSRLGGFYRDQGLHSLVVYDDLGTHALSYTMLAKNLGSGHMTHAQAQILEEAAQMSDQKGGGSSTALCLVQSDQTNTAREKHVEVISSYVDNTIHLDPDLVVQNIWPPINCGKLVGLPPSRFQPPILHSIRSRLNTLLRQSEVTANQYAWAKEFGLQPDDMDMEVLYYRNKLQTLLSQLQHIKTTPGLALPAAQIQLASAVPLPDLLVVLHAAVRGGLDCLDVDDRKEIDDYVKDLVHFVKTERAELFAVVSEVASKQGEQMTHMTEVELDKACDAFNKDRFPYVPPPRV